MGSPDTSQTTPDWRELTSRQNDGLAIALLWSEATDRVKVVVADRQESFELDVEHGEALDAFYHPFAYEASGAGAAPARPLASPDNCSHSAERRGQA